MTDEPIVYDVKWTYHYLGLSRGVWYTWPAEKGGWKRRRVCPAPADDDPTLERLDAEQARLALKLTGARRR